MKEHFDYIVALLDVAGIPYETASDYGGYGIIELSTRSCMYVYEDKLSFWLANKNTQLASTDIQQLLELIYDSRT
jgi:uncharacterized protein